MKRRKTKERARKLNPAEKKLRNTIIRDMSMEKRPAQDIVSALENAGLGTYSRITIWNLWREHNPDYKTHNERRAAVRRAWADDPERTLREIAEETGTSKKFVWNIIRHMPGYKSRRDARGEIVEHFMSGLHDVQAIASLVGYDWVTTRRILRKEGLLPKMTNLPDKQPPRKQATQEEATE